MAKEKAGKRQCMTRLKNQDWMDTLQNTAQAACNQHGNEAVTRYLQEHFGVSSVEELSSTDYDRAFDDLDVMASD